MKRPLIALLIFSIVLVSGCVGENGGANETGTDGGIKEKLSLKSCETISGSAQKDLCFESVANEARNAALCENIISGSRRDYCYYNNLNGAAINTETCNKISSHLLKDSCWQKAETITNEAGLCKNIADKKTRSDCFFYASLDRAIDNPGICDEEISDLNQRDVCLNEVAVLTKNSSVCLDIMSKNIKSECVNSTASGN